MALGDNKFKKSFKKHRDDRPLTGIRVCGMGPMPSALMLIGERPGKQDVQGKEPKLLSGIGGQEMERYLAAGDLLVDSCYITTLVKDYRDGEPPSAEEISHDEAELRFEIDAVQPYIIGALGKGAVEWFIGPTDMDTVHGIPISYAHPDLGDIILHPILHPAAGYYNADHQPLILQDFRDLGRVVRGELQPRIPGQHTPWVAVHEPHDIQLHDSESMSAFDTEGWLHNPWGLSFSERDGLGWVARKGDNSVGHFNHRLEIACRDNPHYKVYLHHALHDLPILAGLGVTIPEDRIRDTMVLAYLLGTEPQGLKALAYRHCNMKMQSYEEVVKPYYAAVFEEYIRTAAEIPNLPEYEEEYVIIVDGAAKIKKPWGIARHLRRVLKDAEKANTKGEDFDFAKRWEGIDDYKKTVVVRALGEAPEPSLEYVPADEAIQYSGCDAIATRRIAPILERKITERGLQGIAAIDHAVIPMFDRMQRVGIKANPDYYDRLADECTELLSANRAEIQKLTGADINVDSGDQVAELLFNQLGLDRKVDFYIPTTESEERLSTNDKILEALRFTHPVVGLVCTGREISKVRSSFCWPISRYARNSKDRRIHPNFKLTRVSSGRPSCTKPNLLAIPTRTTLGKRVREGLEADEGHVLGDWDLSQIELRYLADESQDTAFLEAFRNNIDIHDQTGSLISGIPLDRYVADKPTRKKWRDPAKRVNFGIATGITKVGLAAQMRLANATKNDLPLSIGDGGGIPWTEDDCDAMITDYFGGHPGVRRYLDDSRAFALRHGFVSDRWGRVRLLPAAHSPISRIREEALRQSHSHKIQSGAAGIMKQAQAMIWEYIKQWQAEGRYIEPLLQVYDELLLELEDDDAFKEEVDQVVVHCLTTAVTLSVPLGAEGGYGYNWKEAKG